MKSISHLSLLVFSLLYVGCAATSQQRIPNQVSTDFGKNVEFDQSGKVLSKVLIDDNDSIQNIGANVVLKINNDIHIKPKDIWFEMYQLSADKVCDDFSSRLNFAGGSVDYNRIIKSGAKLEIEKIDIIKPRISDCTGYAIDEYRIIFKKNNKFTDLKIRTPYQVYGITIGQFKKILSPYFDVIQPKPIQID